MSRPRFWSKKRHANEGRKRARTLNTPIGASQGNLLVCDEDLEGRDEVRHGDGLVTLPLLVVGDIINEDEEVVLLALVVDLDLRSFSLDHFD